MWGHPGALPLLLIMPVTRRAAFKLSGVPRWDLGGTSGEGVVRPSREASVPPNSSPPGQLLELFLSLSSSKVSLEERIGQWS